MALALYRKYRPTSLDGIIGQEHITTALKNALKTGAISHAYLLTGPRGLGKTSIARILAHEINQLPYTDDSMHLDIIEIDAASNRRIDEIRDLRDKVHIAPTSAKYKVYIIDEVHMLTREAFNALLKTLEEPPEHAIFILATTEAHKVPDTIVSRTQRYNFKPVSTKEAAAYLGTLAKKEKISIDEDALTILAEHGGGSFRDSINLLDQLASGGTNITKIDIERMLGIPDKTVIDDVVDAISSQDPIAIATRLQRAQQDGLHASKLAKQLSVALRERFLSSPDTRNQETARLLKELALLAGGNDSYTALEIALFEHVVDPKPPATGTAPQSSPPVQPRPNNPVASPNGGTVSHTPLDTAPGTIPSISTPKSRAPDTIAENESPKPAATHKPLDVPRPLANTQAPKVATVHIETTHATTPVAITQVADDTAFWPAYLTLIKQHKNTLYSILRIARPDLTQDTLTLYFSFSFHHKQISQATTQSYLAELAEQLLGRKVRIVPILQKDTPQANDDMAFSAPATDLAITVPTQPAISPPPASGSTLTDVSSIFSGAELME